jgi:ABC-type polysaccharide/polyol phosphate export permease
MYSTLPVVTSIWFAGPVFLSNKIDTPTSLLLLTTSLVSATFWSNPVAFHKTWIHKAESIFARLSIGTIIFRQIVYPRNTGPFALSTSIMLWMFHLSSVHSSIEWLSSTHITYHLFAHGFAIVSLVYTFN